MDALLFWACVQRGSGEWAPGVWVAVGPTHAPHLPAGGDQQQPAEPAKRAGQLEDGEQAGERVQRGQSFVQREGEVDVTQNDF